tara:strand:+ start:211 stop:1371 length:1161 start_codon:yes stop_codon:yes gene_type:complete
MLKKIQYLTAGESHGKGLLGIINGIPANLEIDESYIRNQLARRQRGHGRGKRMKIETDYAEIYSGVRLGQTIGAPIGLIINNADYKNWVKKMPINATDDTIKKITLPRPGHADLAGIEKFGFSDIRNVIERSSARETAMRVAIGSVCRKLLEDINIYVGSRVVQIHDVIDKTEVDFSKGAQTISHMADQSEVRCISNDISSKMKNRIDEAKTSGDSVGGKFEVFATGVPIGLGSYSQWFDRLQSKISESIMSINAIKGIEFSSAFENVYEFGSKIHDEIGWDGKKYIRHSNNAGGIEGGISNSEPILFQAAMKPIPTLIKPLKSVDIITKEEKLAHKERTDSCAVPAASVIAESMLCIVLADSILEKFGGDSLEELKRHMSSSKNQ